MSQEKNQNSIFLYVTHGPHKGEAFTLSKKTIIGRSDQAQVCLGKDNRISRQHAIIVFANNNFYIKNLSKNNKTFVNKREIKEGRVNLKDKIIIGSSQLEIRVKTNQVQKSDYSYSASSKVKKKKPLNPVRLILILLIAGGTYLFVNKDKKKIESAREIASEVEVDIKEIPELVVKPKSQVNLLAQSEYIKGFRDFKKGQFARSVIHLTNCLNYQPDHTLCNRYLILSQKKIDEIIQYQSIIGRKFLDQKQYKACTSSFRNIAFLVQNQKDPRYQEAKKNEKYCKQMLEGSF